MIVPMNKVSIIVELKDAARAVEGLRSLGLLHVEHINTPSGADIASLREDITLAEFAIKILHGPEFAKKKRYRESGPAKEWKALARHIVDTWKRIDQLGEYSHNIRTSVKEWERWGDFDPETIRSLASKGLHIRLYQIPERELKNLPGGVIVRRIFTSGGMAGCLTISSDMVDIPFAQLPLPKISLSKMRERLAGDERALDLLKKDLEKYLHCAELLLKTKKVLEKELEFHEAVKGMGTDGELSYITGYVPFDAVSKVAHKAKEEDWAFLSSAPSDEDRVPTLIRTPGWVSIIKPVFRLLEILPGYKELDVSPLFLLFLGLFFGMIIGDAGYGILYILLTSLAEIKLGRRAKDKKIFFLLYFFSACAVFWGVMTGTVFGQEWYVRAGFKPFAPLLNNTKFIQALCFFIGAFHLTLGHMWQAARKLPSLAALADIGWIAVLWSAFFFAKMLILSDPLPTFVNYALIGGVSLVVLFTSPQRNIIKAVLNGLGTVALSIMNNFTDVVSYVRLFAVGLAGVAISDTVNSLAAVFGGDNLLIKVVILFMGHTINIILGPISVLVHGIRLNVLEFSGHVGLTWSGTPYRPLESAGE